MTEYYAYEHEVLMKLQEKYNIKAINIIVDKKEIRKTIKGADGAAKEVVVSTIKVGDTIIELCFEHEFEIQIFRERDLEAGFLKGLDTDYVVSHIGTMIENQWLSKIKNE